MRTTILLVVILGLISPAVVGIHSFGAQPSSNKVAVEEISIAELQAAYRSGRITAHAVIRAHLDRIAAYDKRGPLINSLITVNPLALEDADRLDAALKATVTFAGPLHGIPVIIKDNIDVGGTAHEIRLSGVEECCPSPNCTIAEYQAAATV